MPIGTAFGRVTVNGKRYSVVPREGSYKVSESPAHVDIDPRLERRVIWRTFSGGIGKRREEPSLDATLTSNPSYSSLRQNRNSSGIHWGNGGDTRSQDRIFCQRLNQASNYLDSTQQVTLMGDGSVYSFAMAQRAVYALSVAPATWTQSATVGVDTSDIVQYGGNVYLAVGDANSFYTWNQASPTTTWTQRAFQAGHFAVVNNVLWRSVNANIYATVNTDPANQVWTTATVVGDPNTNITELDVWGSFLIIFKQDGIYSLDKTGSVYPLFPGFKTLGTNPRPIGQWRDQYYFAADVGLIWEISKSKVNRIGFDSTEPFPMGGNNAFNVPNVDPTYSIPVVATRGISTTNYLVVGFNQYAGGTDAGAYYLAWDGTAWHPFAFFKNCNALGLGMTGGNQTPAASVLQFSVAAQQADIPHSINGAGNYIFYQTNPLIDPFIASSFDPTPQHIYLTIDNGVLEDEYKVLERVNIFLDNHKTGTCRVAYALDEDIVNLVFQDMGPAQGNLTQGSQQFIPLLPFPTYRKIQLRLTLQGLNQDNPNVALTPATSTPVLRYVIMHYKQRMPQRKVWDIELMADKNLVSSSQTLDVRDSSKIIDDLDVARRNHRQVVFQDIRNKKYTAYVDQVGEQLVNLRADFNPSFIVSVQLVETAIEEVVDTQTT